jgi:hypothetical protein
MARVRKYSVFILLATTMLFVVISAASADTLTPSSFVANTSATFNSVSVYYVDANPLANPWGADQHLSRWLQRQSHRFGRLHSVYGRDYRAS